jgi:hypothetical protein
MREVLRWLAWAVLLGLGVIFLAPAACVLCISSPSCSRISPLWIIFFIMSVCGIFLIREALRRHPPR